MLIYLLTILFIVLFYKSMKKDKRQLRNGFYFIMILFGIYLSSYHMIVNHFKVYAYTPRILFMSIPFFMIIIVIICLADFIVILKKEGKKISAFVPLLFSILMIISMISFGVLLEYWNPLTETLIGTIMCWILIVYIYLSVYGGCAFFVFVIYTILYRALPKNTNVDYIIVHGAGLIHGKVTPLLKQRLNKAIDIYHDGGEHACIIVSGGQGKDEQTSEANAMKEYLLQIGFPSQQIIEEKHSTTTLENIRFSKRILDTLHENYTCLFVTNDYHVLRTAMYAKQVGLKAEGIGCHTALYYFPSAFIREFIAIMENYRKTSLFVFILGILIIILFVQ